MSIVWLVFAHERLDEFFQISHILVTYPENHFQVYLAVLMDNQVAKTHGFDHGLRQFGRDEAFALQEIKKLVGASGRTEPLFTDHVGGKVDTTLDGHLQIE